MIGCTQVETAGTAKLPLTSQSRIYRLLRIPKRYFKQSNRCEGKIDATERFLWDELMCTSKEEHEALFGDAGDFDEDDEEEDDLDFDDCDMDDDF